MKDIYDLTDVSDLPKSTRSILRKNGKITGKFNTMLLSIFPTDQQLSVDQIIVAMYRKYQIEFKTRGVILARINYLVQQNNLIADKKGSYAKA